jgi:transposase
MPAPVTSPLESSATSPGVGTPAAGLVPAPHRRGHGRQRRRGQPMDETRPRPRASGPPAPFPARARPPRVCRPVSPLARAPAPGRRNLRLSRPALDPRARGRRHSPRMWRLVPSGPRQPAPQGPPVESPTADAPRAATRRSGHGPLASGHVTGPQPGAEARGHTLLCVDASGFCPWPSVVRTSAPVGHPPLVQEWYTRDHLSAISASSPAATRDGAGQARPLPAEDVVACREQLRREVPGRLVILWDGAPMHRRRVVTACLAHGAAARLHVERLPADAPELNPGEGLWAHLQGVERRHVCCCDLPRLRRALREAVTRVRRKPRVIEGFFRGAKL